MKIKNAKIHFTFLILIVLSIIFGFWLQLLTAYAVMVIHETAHILAAGFFEIKINKIEVLPFGVMIQLDGDLTKNPKQEIIISLAGPISNVIVMLLCLWCNAPTFFMLSNATIAAINLLPVLPLDGGRALKASLIMRLGVVKAFNFTTKLSKIIIAIICALGATVLVITKVNFSVLIIGAFLITNFACECKNGSLLAMRSLIYSKEKLGNAPIKSTHIAALDNLLARKILKEFSYHSYYVIDVINEDMRISKMITETAVIDAIAKCSSVKLFEISEKVRE
jgi:stage IV sporulation protein FB